MAETQCAPALDCSCKHCFPFSMILQPFLPLIYSLICISLHPLPHTQLRNWKPSDEHWLISSPPHLCTYLNMSSLLPLPNGRTACPFILESWHVSRVHPTPTPITTPTTCLDLYGQCVGSSFFQKPSAELTFRFWFLHLLYMLPPHLRTPVSAPSCSSRNLDIAHDGGSQPSVSSLQITASAFKCHLSRHPPSPACQHFLSGLYHCLWTVSPLLFVLPSLPPPCHSYKTQVSHPAPPYKLWLLFL